MPPGVAVVGCGRWGRHLVRTFARLGALRAVVDIDRSTAAEMSARYRVPALDLDAALADPAVAAVAIATPAASHAELTGPALDAGRHVLVEKPLALDVPTAERLWARAERAGLVLMAGHLLRYHPAFVRLHALAGEGSLGPVRQIHATRRSLGRVRAQENVVWSFAPHDVSMILALTGELPETVQAAAGAELGGRPASVTATLGFPSGTRGELQVSWAHPVKEQRLVVVGEQAMAVFDDRQPWASKLVVHHHRVDWSGSQAQPVPGDAETILVPEREPLEAECDHFLACMVEGTRPRTDGGEATRVLRVLEAVERALPSSRPGIHPTAVVDRPSTIGEGTRIWHFSHVLPGSVIGRDCTIGQNVMIGPNVTVGDRCKIQNNVSVYEGVTLSDGVFCGPSCVFTNVLDPRAEIDRREEFRPTRIGRGATIGANATIVCGNDIGDWSFVAAGAVVTTDVAAHALVAGVPARQVGWVGHEGARLDDDLVCPRSGRRYALREGGLVELTGDDRPVEMADLRAQRRRLGNRLDRAVRRVLDHGRFILGPEVARLEEELAAYCGVRAAVTCASGTDALLLALLAREVGPGDAVFVPAFTFAATAEPVALLGATPWFVDVRPDTFVMDPASLAAAVGAAEEAGLRPVAAIPVDLFGQPADYSALGKVAADAGLCVVADAAQSFGAELEGRRVGSLAEVTCTSFFPTKPLGCYGDGGALLTDDEDLAERARSLRAHGTGADKSDNVRIGTNARLDTLQAAVLLEKLETFDDEVERRRAIAARYAAGLAGAVDVPVVAPDATSVWAQYTVRFAERDRLRQHLRARGIATAVHYPTPLHHRVAYRRFPVSPNGVPVAEALCHHVLSLPFHPYMDETTVDRVVAAVRDGV
ncbi:MAG: aminotransferase class I/II-fold pyridoxal phosphate-dependent enzyme [Actinomycetota bacterium]|nr:aminotransferase class I/II-fold pyridoxal phosphate-dependent enzyme [Actinomycetota bacterium]